MSGENEDILAGYDLAVQVFATRFFGGPTKDMVLDWFEAERPKAVR